MIGTVISVNPDGSVSVLVSGQTLPSLPASPSYSPRAVGDRVEVVLSHGTAFVRGRTAGPPARDEVDASWAFSLVTAAPGAPFVATSGAYVDVDGKRVRFVRASAPPAATSATVAAVELATFRGGAVQRTREAEQGSWAGYGPDMGVAIYPSWSFLAGKTPTRLRATLHRIDGGVFGRQSVFMGRHNLAAVPAATPSLADVQQVASLAVGETNTVDLPTDWAVAFRDGTARGVGITHPSTNVTLDQMDLIVDWT